jgi:hypothetical protein
VSVEATEAAVITTGVSVEATDVGVIPTGVSVEATDVGVIPLRGRHRAPFPLSSGLA